MLRNQQNMAQTLGTAAGNQAGQVRVIAGLRPRSVSSLRHSDSSEERQGYLDCFTETGHLTADPTMTGTSCIKRDCQCMPGDPSAAVWARLIVSRALSS